jgi:hypothetical protein
VYVDFMPEDEAQRVRAGAYGANHALDTLALRPSRTLGVTGAAGAGGGYAVELGVGDGLRVIAAAAPKDEARAKRFGASIVVPRGDATIRGPYDAAPGGAAGLIDAAGLDAVLPAIRDGSKLAMVRGDPARPSEGSRWGWSGRPRTSRTRRWIGRNGSSRRSGSPCAWWRPSHPIARPTPTAATVAAPAEPGTGPRACIL